jgi:hypothetical protein
MTDMQSSDGAILKTDTQGRVQTPAAQRERLLDEFETSGLSGTKFAALVGVKYQTFAGWAARRRKLAGAKTPVRPADPVRWLEAVVQEAQGPRTHPSAALVLRLPGGAQLELTETKQAPLAAALLQALARPC